MVRNIELDSCVDTKSEVKNCTFLAYTHQKRNVASYSDKYEPVLGVSIVHVATRYTKADGRNFMLILNEAPHMPNLPRSLINQN